MIGRLRGTLAVKLAETVLVDVGGAGYEIAVAPRTIADLPGPGEEVVVHTHLHVREDAMALYGFATEDDRDLFRMLLGASGVGPKLGMAIMATLTTPELTAALLAEDVDALCAVPGIGKRSAQKLILELRPRLQMPDAEVVGAGSSLAEVRDALEGLGYQASEIREAMDGLDEEDDVGVTLKAALQRLGRR
jgi:Holliday junction DNA helicase RuvA